jgi:hypothetical protein
MKNRTLSALLVGVLTIPVGSHMVAQDANSENAAEKTASKADRFIVFQVPDASCAAGGFPSCTIPVGIDAEETAVGYYFDSIDATHGFLRLADGTITTFDVPGSVCINFSSNCAMPTSINSAGAVVGYYSDGTATHGFLRDRYGDYTSSIRPGPLSPNQTRLTGMEKLRDSIATPLLVTALCATAMVSSRQLTILVSSTVRYPSQSTKGETSWGSGMTQAMRVTSSCATATAHSLVWTHQAPFMCFKSLSMMRGSWSATMRTPHHSTDLSATETGTTRRSVATPSE